MTEHFGTVKIDGHTRISSQLFPKGDFVVIHEFDPSGMSGIGYHIWCVKHQTAIKAEISLADMTTSADPRALNEKLLAASAACPNCVADRAVETPATRWPEGAEL